MPRFVDHEDAPADVRAIYDEIAAVRGFSRIPAFYRALAIDPVALRGFWARFRAVMARGRISALEKELIGIAVCATLGARYCTEAHVDIARRLGMDDETLGELLETIAVFSETAAICKTLSLDYDGAA